MTGLKCLFGILIALSTTGAIQATESTDKTPIKRFTVTEVNGTVLYWQPWGAKWRTLRPKFVLKDGTLVQVTPGAEVSFETERQKNDQFKGFRADRFVAKIKDPMVFRVTDDLFRKTSFSTYVIDQMPEMQRIATRREGVLPTIREAWNRIIAIMAGRVIPQRFARSLLGTDAGVELIAHAKRIKLFAPPKDSILVSDEAVTTLPIRWRPISEKDPIYEVTVWKKGEEMPPPVARVTQTEYSVKVFGEGTFMYQVTALDGRYQSEVLQFHVALPTGNFVTDKETNLPLAERQHPNPLLPLVFPPPNFALVSDDSEVTINFAWEPSSSIPSYAKFVFRVTDPHGQEVRSITTNSLRATMKFTAPGEFFWQVDSVVPSDLAKPFTSSKQNKRFLSEARRFWVMPATKNPLDQVLRLSKTAMAGGTVYLQSGL